MEILKPRFWMLLAAAATLSACSLLSPQEFANTLTHDGITANLAANADIGAQLGAASQVRLLGLVGSPGRVWVITNLGVHGYSSVDLSAQESLTFVVPVDIGQSNFYESSHWNAVTTDAQGTVLLWTLVTNDSGVRVMLAIPVVPGTGPEQWNLTVFDPATPYRLPVGYDSGALELEVNLSPLSGQRKTGGVNVGSPLTFAGYDALAKISAADSGLFAVDATPAPAKLSERHYLLSLTETAFADWSTSTAITHRTVGVVMPPTFVEHPELGTPPTYTFHVLEAGGHTFVMPTFGVRDGNNTTGTVVVIDNATGDQLAAQTTDDNPLVAVEDGTAWFTLGPNQISALSPETLSTRLRKYTW